MTLEIPASTLENFTTFGDLLRFLRRRAGITQMELSLIVGYSDAQISRLEQNLRLPDIPMVHARFVPALGLESETKAVARLLDLAANVRREDAPGLGLCPYKGLAYFDEHDSDLFVGREDLTARLSERVRNMAGGGSEAAQVRFLGIVGASGSGKSSLVRAGLVPALRWDKRYADWEIHVLTPTAHPLASLAAGLTEDRDSVIATTTLMDDLARDARALQTFAKRKLASQKHAHLLLVIDQFEELFSLCRSEEERTAFLSALLTSASELDGRVLIVVALRADFYSHCAGYVTLRGALASSQEYIGAMTEDELRRAIEEPARRGRWEFESGLVDLLLHDVGHEPGALPLLSHALFEIWQRRRGRLMTFSGYASSGGVRGAIAETAEAVFVDQFTHEQQELARRIFLRLTEFGDETSTEDTRRRVTFDELLTFAEQADPMRDLLQHLADARLVTAEQDVVEVAHEALIREWPRLRAWLEENRQGLRLQRQLTDASREWTAHDREPDFLFRGARLTQAEEWRDANESELNEVEREFLAASIAGRHNEIRERDAQRERELHAAQKLVEAERQHSRQLGRRALYLSGAVIAALVMASAALFFGAQVRGTAIAAQTERRLATSRELAAASLNNLSVDPERSILLALQAISTTRVVDGMVLPEAAESLHRSIVASPIRLTLRGHDVAVLSAAYSPDGERLATIGADGTAIVWDAATGQELLRIPGSTTPTGFVSERRVAFNPDGSLLATCNSAKIEIFHPVSGDLVRELSAHRADVTAVSFNPQGTRIASGDITGRAVVWDAASGEPIVELAAATDAIEDLTFGPDGSWLVTANADTSMKVWDSTTGELLHAYTDFTGGVTRVTFSADGSQFAFATADGLHLWHLALTRSDGVPTISSEELLVIPLGGSAYFSPDGSRVAATVGAEAKMWDTTDGRELLSFIGHRDWVMGLAFHPDGTHLASTSLDGEVRIWDTGAGQELLSVETPRSGYGTRTVYNPTSPEFATNGGDGSATLWDGKTGKARLRLAGHNQEVLSMTFSADGKLFAAGSLDGTAIVWDRVSGRKLMTLPGHEFGVRDIAFSPDGKLIATGGFDGVGRLWDTATGNQVHEISGHQGLVLGVAFSPDGIRLVTSSTDQTAKVWDTQSAGLLQTLEGHTSGIPDVAWSPDGTKIVTGSKDATAILWDATTGDQILTLRGHSGEVQSVAFSPDGKMIATGSGDNTAKVWDVGTGEELLTLPGSLGGVAGVVFNTLDGGPQLVVASNDGVVRVFQLQLEEVLALARARVTRGLTTEECRKYLHVDMCPSQTP